MTYFTLVSIVPVRAEAAHRSEMVTQLLFGELCEELEAAGDFIKVKCGYDGYEGWVQRSQLSPIETNLFDQTSVAKAIHEKAVLVNGVSIRISPGSEFYFSAAGRNQINKAALIIGPNKIEYNLTGIAAAEKDTETSGDAVLRHARTFLGAPYLWGGKSIWGIDCSGLVQNAFKMSGMFVPRDAWQQAEGGDPVGFLQESVPGDLAFFDNVEGRITHVGMLLNDHEILHASGVVRIDPIDNLGIVHKESGKRTHSLRIIKRFF